MVRFWSFKALNSLEFKGGHTGGVILTQNGPKMVENGRLQLKIWVNLEENGQKWLKMTFIGGPRDLIKLHFNFIACFQQH